MKLIEKRRRLYQINDRVKTVVETDTKSKNKNVKKISSGSNSDVENVLDSIVEERSLITYIEPFEGYDDDDEPAECRVGKSKVLSNNVTATADTATGTLGGTDTDRNNDTLRDRDTDRDSHRFPRGGYSIATREDNTRSSGAIQNLDPRSIGSPPAPPLAPSPNLTTDGSEGDQVTPGTTTPYTYPSQTPSLTPTTSSPLTSIQPAMSNVPDFKPAVGVSSLPVFGVIDSIIRSRSLVINQQRGSNEEEEDENEEDEEDEDEEEEEEDDEDEDDDESMEGDDIEREEREEEEREEMQDRDRFEESHAMYLEALLGMGFPARWCEVAMDFSGGDLDEALNYILSNGDALEQMTFSGNDIEISDRENDSKREREREREIEIEIDRSVDILRTDAETDSVSDVHRGSNTVEGEGDGSGSEEMTRVRGLGHGLGQGSSQGRGRGREIGRASCRERV